MPFIQENKIELNLGLKKEYKIIHISDVHAIDFRESDTTDVKAEAIRCEEVWRKQRPWFAGGANEYCGPEHEISTKESLINLINYINEEKPDCAVLTGDIIDYYSDSNYALLKEECERINVPYVFSCGNHETPVERFKDINKNTLGFTVKDFNEFKVISLDNSRKCVSSATLEALKKELEEIKPVIISMHVPISTSYNEEAMKKYDPYFVIYDNSTDEVTQEFINILKDNPNIKAILCGHVHGHLESYFAIDKIQCCASSGLIGLVNKIKIK